MSTCIRLDINEYSEKSEQWVPIVKTERSYVSVLHKNLLAKKVDSEKELTKVPEEIMETSHDKIDMEKQRISWQKYDWLEK